MLLDNIIKSYASQEMTEDFQYCGKAFKLSTVQNYAQTLTQGLVQLNPVSPYESDYNEPKYMLLGCPGFYYSQTPYVVAAPVTNSYLRFHLDKLREYVRTAVPADFERVDLPFISQDAAYYPLFGNIGKDEATALSVLTGKTTDDQKRTMLCLTMRSFIRQLYVFQRLWANEMYLKSITPTTDVELTNKRISAIVQSYRLNVLGSMAEEYFSYCFSWVFRNLAIFDSKYFYKGTEDKAEFATYDSHNGDLIVCSLQEAPHLLKAPSTLASVEHLNIDLKLCQKVSATSLKNFGNSPRRWYVLFSDSGDHVYFVRAITLRKYINEHNIDPVSSDYDVSSFIEDIDEFKLFISKSKTL